MIWFCSVALKNPVCDMSQNTSVCRKIELLMQPRPKLWNRNRRTEGGLNIVLRKKLTLRPYLTYEKQIKIRKKDLNYLFLGSFSASYRLSPAPNLSVIEDFRQY
jgi:hypothetical protein